MQAIDVTVILALSFGVMTVSGSADDVLSLDASEAEAKIQPRDDEHREIRLPDLDFALVVKIRCPADTSPESLTIGIADSHRYYGAAELADTAALEATVTVPASQLAPVSADGFCLHGAAVSSEYVVVPGATAAHASLRCRSGSGISMHFASAVPPVRLSCPALYDQAPPADR